MNVQAKFENINNTAIEALQQLPVGESYKNSFVVRKEYDGFYTLLDANNSPIAVKDVKKMYIRGRAAFLGTAYVADMVFVIRQSAFTKGETFPVAVARKL